MGKRLLSRLNCANNGGLGCRAYFSTVMGQLILFQHAHGPDAHAKVMHVEGRFQPRLLTQQV